MRSLSGSMCGKSPKPLAAAMGNCATLFRRGSQNLPLPCIARFATNAFQWGTEPQPVQVWRFDTAKSKGSRNQSCAGHVCGGHDAVGYLLRIGCLAVEN